MDKIKKYQTTVVIDLDHKQRSIWKHNMEFPKCDDKVLTESAEDTSLKLKKFMKTPKKGNN